MEVIKQSTEQVGEQIEQASSRLYYGWVIVLVCLVVMTLAAPLGMSLPGVLKHVRVLEEAHLIETHKEGRTRWCRLADHPLDGAAGWIGERREQWERRLDLFARQVAATKAMN